MVQQRKIGSPGSPMGTVENQLGEHLDAHVRYVTALNLSRLRHYDFHLKRALWGHNEFEKTNRPMK